MALGAVVRRNQPRFGPERSGLLQQARLGGPMPWVIAIMIALTVMAAAAGLALSNLAHNASDEIAGGLTVQIVEADSVVYSKKDKPTPLVLFQVVKGMITGDKPNVADVRQLDRPELQAPRDHPDMR